MADPSAVAGELSRRMAAGEPGLETPCPACGGVPLERDRAGDDGRLIYWCPKCLRWLEAVEVEARSSDEITLKSVD